MTADVSSQPFASEAELIVQRHDLDPADDAFAALACDHPDRCSCPADYPDWTPECTR